MTNLRKALLAGAVIAALSGAVLAQTKLGYNTWNGVETWDIGIGSPGGSSAYITLSQVRNTTGKQLLGSASGTIAPTTNVDNLLVNAQPAASTTINTPIGTGANPPLTDAELFAVCNVTGSAWATNTTTLTAAAGQSINGGSITLTTLASHTCVELQYDLPSTTWYQVR
jgi:hypothetical protein